MAKGRIGSLNVLLSLNSAQFSKGLRRANKTVSAFGAGIFRVGASVARWGSILGGVAVGGLALLTKRSMSQIDATAKLSDRLNIATNRLTGLQHAAKLAGVENEALGKSLEKMNVNIGDATRGTGEAFDAFKKLGLNAKQLARQKADVSFGQIADSMNQLKTAAEKADVAMAIFGKSGVALINTLAIGSKGLEAMQRESAKLGLSFSRLEGRQVEGANDSLTKIGEVLTGIGNSIAIKVAPFIEALADKLTDVGTSGKGMKGIVGDAFESIIKWVGWAANGVETFLRGIESVRIGLIRSHATVKSLLGDEVGAKKLMVTAAGREQLLKKRVRGGMPSEAIDRAVAGIRQTSFARAAIPEVSAARGLTGSGGAFNPARDQLDAMIEHLRRIAGNTDGGIGLQP